MQNYGPGSIMVDTGSRDDVELESGATRIMFALSTREVATTDGKPALLEFEFIPGAEVIIEHNKRKRGGSKEPPRLILNSRFRCRHCVCVPATGTPGKRVRHEM